MVEHKFVSFTTVLASWTLVTLPISLIRILLKWKYIQEKLCHFGHYVTKAKLFCLKSFVPVTRGEVFIWENFHPGYRYLGTQTSPGSHMNTSKYLRRKEWQGKISETEPARLTVEALRYQQLTLQCVECSHQTQLVVDNK